MKIVTSGAKYIDIDAYAGCIAYAELLRLCGHEAEAVCSAPLNESITSNIREWRAPLQTTYKPSIDDTFTVIDVSDPEHFETFVDTSKVEEVIDHHPGFETYWHERIGDKAHIEVVGAACTQVYEAWIAAGKFDNISTTSARLLVAGVLDNTLNFGAHISTERDKTAYQALLTKADLPKDWTAHYFEECQQTITQDVVQAIINDTKQLQFKTFHHPLVVGQLVVWNAQQLLHDQHKIMQHTLEQMSSEWLLNVVSISDKASYFLCTNIAMQDWLSTLLNLQFDSTGTARADRLWLRKEILIQDITAHQTS
jgi:nanoRNase/pAp phosphatase (c-di-AMP/oligoRNAs hydrolase)